MHIFLSLSLPLSGSLSLSSSARKGVYKFGFEWITKAHRRRRCWTVVSLWFVLFAFEWITERVTGCVKCCLATVGLSSTAPALEPPWSRNSRFWSLLQHKHRCSLSGNSCNIRQTKTILERQQNCHQQHVCLYDRRKRKQSYRTSGTTVMADNITIIEIATFSTPTGLAKHHHHQHPILMRTSTLGELQKSLWQQCHYCQNYHHQQLCLPLGEQITWKTMYLFCVYFHIFLSQNINDQQSSTLLHAAHHCK